MNTRNNIDLYWTQEGDFSLDTERGDLLSTKNDQNRGFIQQVLTRLMSNRGDWKLAQGVGANISDFLGQPNTRVTGGELQSRVISELTKDGLILPAALKVDVIPTSDVSVEILIGITPPGSRRAVLLRFGYDLAENRLVARIG